MIGRSESPMMSRTAARKRISGNALQQHLESAGVAAPAGSNRGLTQEAPFSYRHVAAPGSRAAWTEWYFWCTPRAVACR
jgi:tRNA-splicing ligase RtcB